MVFSEFRRRFDVLAPHLTKKHGRNYIVVDEKRVGLGLRDLCSPPPSFRALCPSFLDTAGWCLFKVITFQPTMARTDTTLWQPEVSSEHRLQHRLERSHCC